MSDLGNSLPPFLSFDPEVGLVATVHQMIRSWSDARNQAAADARVSVTVPTAAGPLVLGLHSQPRDLDELAYELAAGSLRPLRSSQLPAIVQLEADPDAIYRYLRDQQVAATKVGLHVIDEEVTEFAQVLTLQMTGTSGTAADVPHSPPVRAVIREVTVLGPDGTVSRQSPLEDLDHLERYSWIISTPMVGDYLAILRYELYQGNQLLRRPQLRRRLRVATRPAVRKVIVRFAQLEAMATTAPGERVNEVFVTLYAGGSPVLSRPFSTAKPAPDLYVATLPLWEGRAVSIEGVVQAYLPGGPGERTTDSPHAATQVSFLEVEHLHPGEVFRKRLYIGRAQTATAFAEANLDVEVTVEPVSDDVLRSAEIRRQLLG